MTEVNDTGSLKVYDDLQIAVVNIERYVCRIYIKTCFYVFVYRHFDSAVYLQAAVCVRAAW